jgi:xanthine/uracil permease
MFLPAEFAWAEPVLIAAGVVFVVGLIGNVLSFSNRFVNALVTAVLFAVIFGTLFFLSKAEVPPTPVHFLPGDYSWLEPVLVAAGVVFVVDLIGNVLSFSNRFVNALVTALVFAAIFGGLTYMAKQEGIEVPTITVPAPTPEPTPTP